MCRISCPVCGIQCPMFVPSALMPAPEHVRCHAPLHRSRPRVCPNVTLRAQDVQDHVQSMLRRHGTALSDSDLRRWVVRSRC
eukprot:2029799-Rhodomonas_salina.1